MEVFISIIVCIFIAAICLRNMAHGYTDKHKSIDDESIANTLFLMSSSI